MSRMTRVLFTVAALAVSALSTFAQNSVSVTSLFQKPGQPISDSCKEEVQVFEQIASVYPHPKSGWKFIIVCDENSWRAAIQRMGLVNEPGEHYGETDIDRGITLFRGWALTHPGVGGATPERIVVHELQHIMLHSRDENLVDTSALKL